MFEIQRGIFAGTVSSWGIYDNTKNQFFSQEGIGKVICYEIFPKLQPGKEYRIKINVEITEAGDDECD